MAGRFIKLYEQILKWEWYQNTNTFRLFIHLLLKANYCDLRFKGKEIKRGQLAASLPSLSRDTGLTIQQVRTALEHLISTGEVTDEPGHGYRIITITKYDEFQSATDKTTGKQQANNTQVNRRVTASIDNIDYIEEIEKIEKTEGRGTAKRFTPPSRDDILLFCNENGLTLDVDRFLNYYQSNGWMVGKNRMKDWKATVRNWASKEDRQPVQYSPSKKTVTAQQYTQRDYSDVQDEAFARYLASMEKGVEI